MIPTTEDLAAEIQSASQCELPTKQLLAVYRTGVMYSTDCQDVLLNDTSLGLTEGRILWYLARKMRPDFIIETGFGRGGSAAFFLAAVAPWNGKVISIDPAFRYWAQDTGLQYIQRLGLAESHRLVENPSELALAELASNPATPGLKVSYIDGSHHFDGTLIDFMYLDRMTEVGGVIAIDDAQAPAIRTVASFVANNLPYHLHYATQRLLLCHKNAQLNREWCHFRPFHSSRNSDWNCHVGRPSPEAVPGATFGEACP
jgi:predicted O-methyltransferase YrrM